MFILRSTASSTDSSPAKTARQWASFISRAVSSSAYWGRKKEYHSKSYLARTLSSSLKRRRGTLKVSSVNTIERTVPSDCSSRSSWSTASTGISVSGPWLTGYSQKAQWKAQLRAVRRWTMW